MWIIADDYYNNENEILKSFVIPGGNLANSYIHLSRTICRRAERSCVSLLNSKGIPDIVVVYLNRFSLHDYNFLQMKK